MEHLSNSNFQTRKKIRMNHNYFSISAYLDIPIMAALKDADESQRLCEILLHLKTSID